jgi:hypothetical protein
MGELKMKFRPEYALGRFITIFFISSGVYGILTNEIIRGTILLIMGLMASFIDTSEDEVKK